PGLRRQHPLGLRLAPKRGRTRSHGRNPQGRARRKARMVTAIAVELAISQELRAAVSFKARALVPECTWIVGLPDFREVPTRQCPLTSCEPGSLSACCTFV